MAITFRSVGRVNIYEVAVPRETEKQGQHDSLSSTTTASAIMPGTGIKLNLVAGYELSFEPCDMYVCHPGGDDSFVAHTSISTQAHIFFCLPGPVYFKELIFNSRTNEICQAAPAPTLEDTQVLVAHSHVNKLLDYCASNNLSFIPAYAGSEEATKHAHGAGS